MIFWYFDTELNIFGLTRSKAWLQKLKRGDLTDFSSTFELIFKFLTQSLVVSFFFDGGATELQWLMGNGGMSSLHVHVKATAMSSGRRGDQTKKHHNIKMKLKKIRRLKSWHLLNAAPVPPKFSWSSAPFGHPGTPCRFGRK